MENVEIVGLFSLQWHLTDACPNHCSHCYITADMRAKRKLSLNQLCVIATDFFESFRDLNLMRSISFTGGDPLLHPYFWKILRFVRERGGSDLEINILGTPTLLTRKTVVQLEEQGVRHYQLSLDGMKNTHDFFRGKGSFSETVKALKMLSKTAIKPIVQSTVSKINFGEMPEIADVAIDNGAALWDFSRFVPTKENIKAAMFNPLEYRLFLEGMKEHYLKSGYKYNVGRKDPLWILLEPPEKHEECGCGESQTVSGGCTIGSLAFSILPDGKVMGCRRHLGSTIGVVPEEKFEDIFFESRNMCKMQKLKKIKKCQKCEWLFHCRGCRAVAFGVSQDLYASDPQCWL
ncbi:MAG: radical SAM protein [Parcubacteria group bacterium]